VIKWVQVAQWSNVMHPWKWLVKRNEMLAEATNGRFIIESHPHGEIMSGKEAFDATNEGTIDALNSTMHTWIGKIPASPLFSARPLGLTSTQMVAWLEHYGGKEYMKEVLKPFNFGYTGYTMVTTPEDLCWSNTPLDTLESWKGVKFRTKGLWAEVLQDPRVGASVTTIAGAELYSAAEKGILDAFEYSNPATDIQLGFYEIMKYLMVPGIHQPATVLWEAVNADSWAALPDDLKEIYDAVNHKVALLGYTDLVLEDAKALKAFSEMPNLTIISLPDKLQQQFFEIADDLYKKKSAEDPFFAEVYQSQLDFKKEWQLFEQYQTPKT
jgi:TRAP-type mannitol/chloroaromatic compound transport system substrate-binding protein